MIGWTGVPAQRRVVREECKSDIDIVTALLLNMEEHHVAETTLLKPKNAMLKLTIKSALVSA